jgi:hypothetical protein
MRRPRPNQASGRVRADLLRGLRKGLKRRKTVGLPKNVVCACLAAISGVNGVFSGEDIEHVRKLALAARARRPAARKKAPASRRASQ